MFRTEDFPNIRMPRENLTYSINYAIERRQEETKTYSNVRAEAREIPP